MTYGNATTTDEVLDGIDLTGRRIVIMCRSGSRSQQAIAAAQASGRSDVTLNFTGGIKAWQAAGGAVAR